MITTSIPSGGATPEVETPQSTLLVILTSGSSRSSPISIFFWSLITGVMLQVVPQLKTKTLQTILPKPLVLQISSRLAVLSKQQHKNVYKITD